MVDRIVTYMGASFPFFSGWDANEGRDYDDVWPLPPLGETQPLSERVVRTSYSDLRSTSSAACLHIRIKSATLPDKDLSDQAGTPSINAVWDGFNIAAVIDADAGAESGDRVMDTLTLILAGLCRCLRCSQY